MPPPAPRLGTVLTAADKAKRDALSNLVDSYVEPYLARNATCADAVNKLFPGTFDLRDRGWVPHSDKNPPNFRNFRKRGQKKIKWDHLAFRSFDCVDGGLTAVAGVFERFGYTEQGELRFAEKKVVARWFAPPDEVWAKDARGEPLFPRLFVSHVLVSQLSSEAQAVIKKRQAYCEQKDTAANCCRPDTSPKNEDRALNAAEIGGLPWWDFDQVINLPSYEQARETFGETLEITPNEYQTLQKESEYAAWTLVHGHRLNHVAIGVHGLFVDADVTQTTRRFPDLEHCVSFLNLQMSTAGGGVVKISPDGLLKQASTVADSNEFTFVCDLPGVDEKQKRQSVPGCYVEFVERLPVGAQKRADEKARPQFVPERERRDGFETQNADAIFESTFGGEQAKKENEYVVSILPVVMHGYEG